MNDKYRIHYAFLSPENAPHCEHLLRACARLSLAWETSAPNDGNNTNPTFSKERY